MSGQQTTSSEDEAPAKGDMSLEQKIGMAKKFDREMKDYAKATVKEFLGIYGYEEDVDINMDESEAQKGAPTNADESKSRTDNPETSESSTPRDCANRGEKTQLEMAGRPGTAVVTIDLETYDDDDASGTSGRNVDETSRPVSEDPASSCGSHETLSSTVIETLRSEVGGSELQVESRGEMGSQKEPQCELGLPEDVLGSQSEVQSHSEVCKSQDDLGARGEILGSQRERQSQSMVSELQGDLGALGETLGSGGSEQLEREIREPQHNLVGLDILQSDEVRTNEPLEYDEESELLAENMSVGDGDRETSSTETALESGDKTALSETTEARASDTQAIDALEMPQEEMESACDSEPTPSEILEAILKLVPHCQTTENVAVLQEHSYATSSEADSDISAKDDVPICNSSNEVVQSREDESQETQESGGCSIIDVTSGQTAPRDNLGENSGNIQDSSLHSSPTPVASSISSLETVQSKVVVESAAGTALKEKARLRMRKWRTTETLEQREARLRLQRERARKRRLQESEAEKAARREKDRKRQQLKRARDKHSGEGLLPGTSLASQDGETSEADGKERRHRGSNLVHGSGAGSSTLENTDFQKESIDFGAVKGVNASTLSAGQISQDNDAAMQELTDEQSRHEQNGVLPEDVELQGESCDLIASRETPTTSSSTGNKSKDNSDVDMQELAEQQRGDEQKEDTNRQRASFNLRSAGNATTISSATKQTSQDNFDSPIQESTDDGIADTIPSQTASSDLSVSNEDQGKNSQGESAEPEDNLLNEGTCAGSKPVEARTEDNSVPSRTTSSDLSPSNEDQGEIANEGSEEPEDNLLNEGTCAGSKPVEARTEDNFVPSRTTSSDLSPSNEDQGEIANEGSDEPEDNLLNEGTCAGSKPVEARTEDNSFPSRTTSSDLSPSNEDQGEIANEGSDEPEDNLNEGTCFEATPTEARTEDKVKLSQKERSRLHMRKRRSLESAEERQMRLTDQRERVRQRRANESDADREARRVQDRIRQQIRRTSETAESRSKRLQQQRDAARLRRTTESPEVRQARRVRDRDRARKIRETKRAGIVMKWW